MQLSGEVSKAVFFSQLKSPDTGYELARQTHFSKHLDIATKKLREVLLFATFLVKHSK